MIKVANMSTVKLDELENAAILVDDGEGSAKALVARDTGMIHLLNDEYMDEEAPLPGDIEAGGNYVSVPSSRELGLGHELVFRFAGQYLPGDTHTVREFFRKPGAYARFSHLLEERGERDRWHRFRDEETKAALRSWCEEHGLQPDG
jgi:hypothetical protein